MPRAVRFAHYGGSDVLSVVDIDEPHPGPGEAVVRVIAAQLARLAGARVIGTAGDTNAEFLRSLGVEPVRHGDGLLERIQQLAPDGVDAYLDNFGAGNVDLAIKLGVA